jgi:hypothetical protein
MSRVTTFGGVTYELAIPLGTFESLPPKGETVNLFTHLVVRDDEWSLYGFSSARERAVFRRLLAATGVGPALALGMLSRFNADRLVRAIPREGRRHASNRPARGPKEGAAAGARPSPTSWMIFPMTAWPASFRPVPGSIPPCALSFHSASRKRMPTRRCGKPWPMVLLVRIWLRLFEMR